jgi:hypothetical protein
MQLVTTLSLLMELGFFHTINERGEESPNFSGTQFTCVTGTKVQILTQLEPTKRLISEMRDVPPALMLLLSEEARAFGSDKQIAKGESQCGYRAFMEP